MNPRLVYIAGSVAAAALVVFAIWHAAQPKPLPAPIRPAATAADETASAPRIDPEELRERLEAGDVTIIDVRDTGSYLASHIPGALHIELARVQSEVPNLPKAKPIVAYCT